MSIGSFLARSVQILKKEPVILVPYSCFYFFSLILEKQFSFEITSLSSISFSTIQLLLLRWFVDLFVSLLTVSFVVYIAANRDIDISKALSSAFHNLPKLLLSSVAVVFPLIVLVLITGLSANALSNFQALIFISLLIPLSIILQFLPVSTYFNQQGVLNGIKRLILFLIDQKVAVLKLSFLMFFLTLSTYTIGEVFSLIPVIGEALFTGLFFGCFSAFSTTLTVVFYQSFFKRSDKLV